MTRLYIKRTFKDGDWYILKHTRGNNYKIVYIRGDFTLKVGETIENPKALAKVWKHERLTLEQARLETI